MEFEADRMTGLVLTDDVVTPERDVVLEERRMHCDTDPGAQLGEAVQATLFTHHPYGVPIIGWGHEIEGLKREDALAYYHRFYTPENAILVVAGDADPEETLSLAEATYGKVSPRGAAPVAQPPVRAADGRRPPGHGARREGAAAELAAPLSRPVLPHGGAGRVRGARRARPPDRRRTDEPALSRTGHGGEARRLRLGLLPRHGARPEPVHRQRHACAGRRARDDRQGFRPNSGEVPRRRRRRARARTGQDPPRRRRDLRPRQPVGPRAMVRLLARARPDDPRGRGVAGQDRGGRRQRPCSTRRANGSTTSPP